MAGIFFQWATLYKTTWYIFFIKLLGTHGHANKYKDKTLVRIKTYFNTWLKQIQLKNGINSYINKTKNINFKQWNKNQKSRKMSKGPQAWALILSCIRFSGRGQELIHTMETLLLKGLKYQLIWFFSDTIHPSWGLGICWWLSSTYTKRNFKKNWFCVWSIEAWMSFEWNDHDDSFSW